MGTFSVSQSVYILARTSHGSLENLEIRTEPKGAVFIGVEDMNNFGKYSQSSEYYSD